MTDITIIENLDALQRRVGLKFAVSDCMPINEPRDNLLRCGREMIDAFYAPSGKAKAIVKALLACG